MDKKSYENQYEKSKQEKESEYITNKNREISKQTQNLEIELKDLYRKKYESESIFKDNKANYEHKINEYRFILNRLNSEYEELNKKFENMNTLYTNTYRDNERILKEFDEYKRLQTNIQNGKDNDINNLVNETKYVEGKIKEAGSKIKFLDDKI